MTEPSHQLQEVVRGLSAFCNKQGVTTWLVGGAARDIARGVAPGDIDLATDGDGLALARALADAWGGSFVALDDTRDTGRAVVPAGAGRPALTIDIARLRAADIIGDLRLRDFTVNAMAIPLGETAHRAVSSPPSTIATGATPGPRPPASGPWIDPTGGLDDLRAGRLRTCGPSSLTDDPLRIMRAARLCASLGLIPAAELAAQMRAAAPGIAGVAGERLRDELLKLLHSPAAAVWVEYLDSCEVLTRLIPELEPARRCQQPRVHFLPVLEHTLEAVAALEWLIALASGAPPPARLPVAVQAHPTLAQQLPYAERMAELLAEPHGPHSRASLLKLAVLFHDNAKPQTKVVHPDGKISFYAHQEIGADVAVQIARRLRLSRAESRYVELIVREHMRPGQLRGGEHLTMRAVARFFRDLGDAGPDVLLHELADHLAARGPTIDPLDWQAHLAWVGTMLDQFWGAPPERRLPLLSGRDLIAELGMVPGPPVGALLREIAEAQAAGEISTRAEAIELGRRLLGDA